MMHIRELKDEILDKVTLIISTHNRHQYLKRILNYYSDSDLKIVVCDSSDEPFSTRNYPNVTYIHLKVYSYLSKIYECLRKINTPYALLCADDDFIIPDSIERGIVFLAKNPDYVSVEGKIELFYNFNKKIIYRYPKLRPMDISCEKPSERLKKIGLNRYNNLYYCVHRTGNLKQIFDFSYKQLNETDLLSLHEYFLTLMTIINGKHKVLPALLNIIEFHPDSLGFKVMPIHKLILNKEYKKRCDLMLNYCKMCLKNKENLTFNEAEDIILPIWSSMISYNRKSHQSFSTRIMKIMTIFPLLKNKLYIMYYLIQNWKNILFSNKLTLKEYNDTEIKNIKKIEFFIKKYNI